MDKEEIWEHIGCCCFRTPVPGGWLIYNDYNAGHLLFIEDSQHSWKIEENKAERS